MTCRALLLDRLLVAFADQSAADLVLDVGGKTLFDQLLRSVPAAEAGDRRLLAEFLELLLELGIDPLAGDLDRYPLGAGPGVLDLDGIDVLWGFG